MWIHTRLYLFNQRSMQVCSYINLFEYFKHENVIFFCDMVKCELWVASYKLLVMSWSLKAWVEIQKCEFKSTSYEFRHLSKQFYWCPFLNKDWVFGCFKMQVGVSRCCKLCNIFMAELGWEFRGESSPPKIRLFKSGGHIKSLQ